MKFVAVRNLRLCTKDCLCLYVCKTGATDTENSVIDVTKCIGCGQCAAACPSKAISLVPLEYPRQQPKKDEIVNNSLKMLENKAKEELLFKTLALQSDGKEKQLFLSLAKSSRLQAEDLARESRYMLPQSQYTHSLLEDIIKKEDEDAKIIAKKLLQHLPNNDK